MPVAQEGKSSVYSPVSRSVSPGPCLRLRSLLRRTLLAVFAAVLLSSSAFAQDLTNFTFAVFGDSRPGREHYSQVMRKLAADMATQRPILVLGTGDYIEGSSKPDTLAYQWQGFFLAIAPLQAFGTIPVALAPGNHDILGSNYNHRVFCQYFDAGYYSFNRGACHFILLDTEEPGASGRIGSKQLAWLKQDLAANRSAALTFVALHQPLYPVSVHIGSSLDQHPEERDALHALFAREGVDCVFAGHEHLFSRKEKDGVDYVITAGGGAPLYAQASRGGYYHYLLVTVEGGSYRVQVRKL